MNKVMSKHSKIITSSVMGLIIVILAVVAVILIRLNNHSELGALGITDYTRHASCSQTPYVNRRYGFSLKCPEGWEISTILEQNSRLKLFMSTVSSSSDPFDVTFFMPNEKYTMDRFVADTKVIDQGQYMEKYVSASLDGIPITKHIFYQSQYGVGVEYGIQLPSGGFAIASMVGLPKSDQNMYATLWSSELDQYIGWFDFSPPRASLLRFFGL